MSERANEKIKIVLENIFDTHSLGVEYPIMGIKFSVSELSHWHEAPFYASDFAPVTTSEISSILSQLIEKGVLTKCEYVESEESYWIDFPEDFRVQAKKYLNTLSVKNDTSKLIINFDTKGNLWHGDRDLACYTMESSKGRFKIFKYLIDNNDGNFILTSDIANHFGKKDQNIRSEIGKIRNLVEASIGVEDIIENDTGNGYRLNPNYKILPVK